MHCNLAKVPAHAVVSRSDRDLADHIFEVLEKLKVCVKINSQMYLLVRSSIYFTNYKIHQIIYAIKPVNKQMLNPILYSDWGFFSLQIY